MRFSKLLALLAALWLSPAGAQLLTTGAGGIGGGGGGGCTQATTFLARTSGLSGTETAAYTTLICTLVSNGIITGTMAGSGSGATACGSKLDTLYVLATNSTTTANLNLCSTSYGLTANNSPTFTVDQGYTGNGTTSYLESNFSPNTATTPNFTQNSASIFVRSNTNIRMDSAALIGALGTSGANAAYINPWNASVNSGSHALNNTGTNDNPPSSAKGLFTISRQSSLSFISYQDATALGTVTVSSVGLTGSTFRILGATGGGAQAFQFSVLQTSVAGWGAGLSPTDVSNLSTAITAYLTALGVS